MGIRTILVNRNIVEQNHQTGGSDHVFTVIDDQGKEHHASSIMLTGAAELKYDKSRCDGRRVWIETYDKVILKYAMDSEPFCPTLVVV